MGTLGHINKKSGSSYHRIITPLQSFAHFTEDINTTLVVNYKHLWITRKNDISAGTLSIWKELFGIQIVFDLDDSLEIPRGYVNDSKLQKERDSVITKLLTADVVVVSTLELQQELSKLGIESIYIPNRLPYGKGQFVQKNESWEDFINRPINVGIIGSFYHVPNWQKIKGWMNSLVINKEFKQNCKFRICGYHESAHNQWKEFLHLGERIDALPVDKYVSLYNNLDIILCPLKDNWFNRCKSSLKVLEAGCGESVCVLDPLFTEKKDIPDLGHPVVFKEKDWLNIPLQLISDREKLWALKKETSEKCIELEFEPVVKQRITINYTVPKILKVSDQIYSVVYERDQPAEYIRYFNSINTVEEKSYLFEYNVILDIVPQPNKWVGVFSWKFPLKTGLSKARVIRILDEERGKYDGINFCRPLGQSYLKFTESNHKGFMDLFVPLCKDLGLKVQEPSCVIYSNFFVLTDSLFKEYQELLRKAIFLLEIKYSYKANQNANYKAGLPSHILKQKTGLEYYTFHTFILERLISIWIDNKKLKIKNVFN